MERKILICLEVPSVSRTYEVLVPGDLKVRDLTPLLVKAAADLSDGTYVSSGHEFLCARHSGHLLDEDAVLTDYGIGNGEHLIML